LNKLIKNKKMNKINKVTAFNALGRINSNNSDYSSFEVASINKVFNNFIQAENQTRIYHSDFKFNHNEKELFEKVGILVKEKI